MIEVKGNPPKIGETRFSTIKRRAGRESIPFLNLDAGTHLVKFIGKSKSTVCEVKTWLSMYGWAWRIVKAIKDEAIDNPQDAALEKLKKRFDDPEMMAVLKRLADK